MAVFAPAENFLHQWRYQMTQKSKMSHYSFVRLSHHRSRRKKLALGHQMAVFAP